MIYTKIEAGGRTYNQIHTAAELASVVDAFTAPPGFDYETNAQEVYHHIGRIVGVTLAAPVKPEFGGTMMAFYIPVAHQYGTNCDPALLSTLADYLNVTPVTPFHLNTEYQWTLARLKIRLKVAGDGFYAARLLQLADKNLKDLSRVVLGRKEVITLADLLPKGVFDFSILNAQDPRANQYCNDDGYNAYDLEQALHAAVTELGMQGAYELELLAAAVMAEQELGGYLLDPQTLVRSITREKVRLEHLAADIFAGLGTRSFTLNSHVQLGKALKAKGYTSPLPTETGGESWSVDALKLLPPDPVITDIIDWKKTFSFVNTMGRAPLEPAVDGRLHPHWLSMGYSGTPRIYAEKPPLTSLPKASREAFPAPPGMRWFMAAWLQPEIRVLAAACGDANMADVLNTNYDFYTTVGATMAGRQAGEGDERDRTWAKELFYAYMDYCGDPVMVAKRMRVTPEVATATLDHLYRLFPGLQSFADVMRSTMNTQDNPRAVTSFLNRRWFVDPNETGDYAGPAMNAFVQHSVATLLKIVLAQLMAHTEVGHPAMVGFGCVIPVFDRIYYCLDEHIPVPHHLNYMTSMFERPHKGIRMRGEYGVGATWGGIAIITEEAFSQAMADLGAKRTPEWPE